MGRQNLPVETSRLLDDPNNSKKIDTPPQACERSHKSAIFIPPPFLDYDFNDMTNYPNIISNVSGIVSWDNLSPQLKSNKKYFIRWVRMHMLGAIPGVSIATLLILMVSVPFGLSFFPAEWSEFPVSRTVGVQMFLLTTFLSQLVFTVTSSFKCSIGLMMVENIPFMHTLALGIIKDLGPENPQCLPTIVIAYSLSSLLVGIVFYLLGHFRMGSVMYFFPKHIILGTIGGIGLFVFKTGIENSTGLPVKWTWSCMVQLLSSPLRLLWITALLPAVFLPMLSRHFTSSFFPPFFFLSIPPIFYFILEVFGISLASAREQGWLFQQSPNDVSFWTMWRVFSFGDCAWWVIPRQFGSILAITTFSIMHVPINCPSLSLTTSTDADINTELKSHGISNFLGGLCGSCQNYSCYSFSALYYKCGGGGAPSSIAIAIITALFFVVGPNIVSNIPRCMAGSLLIHIGIDLVKEAAYDTYGTLDLVEYSSVIVISLSMTVLGMNQGLAIGAVLACFTFVVQSAPTGPIRGSMSGATLRSNAWRSTPALDMLDQFSRDIRVVQLQGHLFFGNASKLSNFVQDIVKKNACGFVEYLILDFTLVVAMDCSAADRLYQIRRNCNSNLYSLVFASLPPKYTEFCRQLELSSSGSQGVGHFYIASDLNSAIKFSEDAILSRHSYSDKFGIHCELNNNSDDSDFCHLSQLHALCPEESLSLLHELLKYFKKKEIRQYQLLWKQGSSSKFAVLLVSGALRAELEEEAGTTEDIKVGSLVGDLCLLTGEKRKCSVRAMKRSGLFVLDRETLDDLMLQNSRLALLFQSIALRRASQRLQYVGNRIWETKCVPI